MAGYNTPLDGTPNTINMATTENLPLSFDYTPTLLPGETLQNAGSLCTDLTSNSTVTLSGSPTIAGNTVNIEVNGSLLVGAHTYRVVASADVVGVATGKRLSISVILNVAF